MIDWAYLRTSCETCAKTRNYVSENELEISAERDARKDRIATAEAWALLSGADAILTARGTKIRRWDPRQDDRADILADVIGRSGNLRAPTIQVGNVFLVGFNPEMYAEYLGGSHGNA